MKKTSIAIVSALIGIVLGTAFVASAANAPFRLVQSPTIHLYSGISGSATTMRITPYPRDLDNVKLTMNDLGTTSYATIDPKLSLVEEIISFTGMTDNGDNTATLTGVTRDLTSKYPYTTAGTGRTHGAGATVVFSNNPQVYANLGALINDNSWTGINTFPSANMPRYDSDPGATAYTNAPNTVFVDMAQLTRTALAGVTNATPSVQGVVQISTALQAASTTALCSSGAYCVLTSSIATSSRDVTGLHVVVTQNNGYINWNLLDLSQNLAFTGINTHAGLETFNGGTITNASSTVTATSTATAKTIGYNPEFNVSASTTITGFTLPQPITLATSTGAAILASANTYGATKFDGFAITNAVNGGTVVVQTGGIVSGFSALTAGADYYVQNAAGTIGTSIPVPEMYVGTAISTTQIMIEQRDMQYIGTNTVSNSQTVTVPPFTRTILVSASVSETNVSNNSGGALGWNAGASSPSFSVQASTCCTAATAAYTVTWNTSASNAGTVTGSTGGNAFSSGSATLWYYR